jgi:hypothetical protein
LNMFSSHPEVDIQAVLEPLTAPLASDKGKLELKVARLLLERAANVGRAGT